MTSWWESAVIYHIYPRSFRDSNGDGIGDLKGVVERLDYLNDLGVDALWLSPFYPSPMCDFGYDVEDYCNVDPIFGNLDDFDCLLREAHSRGLKLIVDLIPNHTSIQHVWFQESRSSRENAKRDWYIWRGAKEDGSPPNNWTSFFGGSAWTWDSKTQQYYLHQFHRSQPELNYRNPAVVQAMKSVMRFWLDRGVDGFRTDVIWLLAKDQMFRDEPTDPRWNGQDPHAQLSHVYTQDLPFTHELIRDFRKLIDTYKDRVFIGEVYLPLDRLVKYYGEQNDECHIPYNFGLIEIRSWNPESIRHLVETYEQLLPKEAVRSWVLNNHDRSRFASRVRPEQAKVAATLLLSLGGSATIYYGEEIGMRNGNIPSEKIQDPWALQLPHLADKLGRDPVRTPMQWDDSSESAGFSSPGVEPWLPVSMDYRSRNVQSQLVEPNSLLHFYKNLILLRKQKDFICSAVPRFIKSDASEFILLYAKEGVDEVLIFALNFSDQPQSFKMENENFKEIFSSEPALFSPISVGDIFLRPNEVKIFSIPNEC